jgi:hypothetical protein
MVSGGQGPGAGERGSAAAPHGGTPTVREGAKWRLFRGAVFRTLGHLGDAESAVLLGFLHLKL